MRPILLFVALTALALPALAQDAPDAVVPPEREKPSEIRADQLDTLFARLHQPGAQGEALEERIWQLWSSSDSPTAEALLQQSERAIAARAPAEALSILDRLTTAYPDFAEAWNKRATLYFLMKRYDASLRDIDRVLELEPRHFGALSGKGMILLNQKKYAEARAAYEEALAVNPTLERAQEALDEIDRLEQGI